MTRWRWRQETIPGTPEGNMAADARLLDEALAGGPPTFRIYTWDRPCVTLGRSQDEAAVRAVFPDLPLVRRPTGGLAVRHGDDLTVTVAARLDHLPTDQRGILASYHLLAGCLAEAFRVLGIPAQFGGQTPRADHGPDCFAVATGCDLMDERTGIKLAGCAQRRRRTPSGAALLQQMSIPLRHIPDLPQFVCGIREAAALRLGVTEWDKLSEDQAG